jgi:hypothetical protein
MDRKFLNINYMMKEKKNFRLTTDTLENTSKLQFF